MFCDPVGSTALSARRYPEELREEIGPCRRSLVEAGAASTALGQVP
jgi:hypothetical protein